MKQAIRSTIGAVLMIFCAFALEAEYSPWSAFGGLNLVINSDGEGLSSIPGMKSDGNPGGLQSAPSPIGSFFGAEYRYPLRANVSLAPSLSLYAIQYLWANDRPLPAEVENRTAYVPSLLIDVPVLYHFTKNKFLFSFGGGTSILARFAFLEPGVGAEEQNPGEPLAAGDQVEAINAYFWDKARWLYPTLQAGVRYELETGWGGGFSLRVALPVSNLWDGGNLPFHDSLMILAAVTITPPISKKPSLPDTEQTPQEP